MAGCLMRADAVDQVTQVSSFAGSYIDKETTVMTRHPIPEWTIDQADAERCNSRKGFKDCAVILPWGSPLCRMMRDFSSRGHPSRCPITQRRVNVHDNPGRSVRLDSHQLTTIPNTRRKSTRDQSTQCHPSVLLVPKHCTIQKAPPCGSSPCGLMPPPPVIRSPGLIRPLSEKELSGQGSCNCCCC